MNKEIPVLYGKDDNCCACGACVNICPKNAISMKKDRYGFLFPAINSDLCINCKLCKKVCAYQNVNETNTPLKTWVAVSKNKEKLKKSASGGVFYTLADAVIKEKGCAAGAAFDDKFELSHIIAYDEKTLEKLQGSKYTQSSTGLVFREIRKKLNDDKTVLFSGCPCQVAGLKAYLGKDYSNLITVDLICHGVPSNKAFRDYLKFFEKKKNIKVKKFSFRDKSIGWGKNGSIISEDNYKFKLYETAESYLYYFANSLILRKNCYSCKYADSHRTGDITIGDFWGLEKEYPELLGKNKIDESKGVSVIIANTDKGIDFIKKNRNLFDLYKSSFEKAAKGNTQLNRPSRYDTKRETILELYADKGWKAVDERFNKNIGIRKYAGVLKSMIPARVKRTIKRFK